MPVERREQVIAASSGQPDHTGRSPNVQRKAAAFMRWHEPDGQSSTHLHGATLTDPDVTLSRHPARAIA